MLPAILDIEASGFGRGSYPIEVGVALTDGKTHCMIIRRQPDWQHWDEKAASLHGITRETLDTHGYEPLEVANCLNEWLKGQQVYSDAWGNDRSWLALLFEYAGIPQLFKLESLRYLMNDDQAALWHETKEQVMNHLSFERHRASNDAKILQETYRLVISA